MLPTLIVCTPSPLPFVPTSVRVNMIRLVRVWNLLFYLFREWMFHSYAPRFSFEHRWRHDSRLNDSWLGDVFLVVVLLSFYILYSVYDGPYIEKKFVLNKLLYLSKGRQQRWSHSSWQYRCCCCIQPSCCCFHPPALLWQCRLAPTRQERLVEVRQWTPCVPWQWRLFKMRQRNACASNPNKPIKSCGILNSRHCHGTTIQNAATERMRIESEQAYQELRHFE